MKTLRMGNKKVLGVRSSFTRRLFHVFGKLYYKGAQYIFAITLIFTFSCQENVEQEKLQERIKPDMENIYNNKIWFKNSDKDLVLLNKNNINEAFNSIIFDELNNSNLVAFEKFEFRLFEDQEKGDRVYSVNGTSKDGTVNSSLILAVNDEGDFQVMSGCTCTSIDCAHNWGCNVAEFGPCSCSPCDGKCEKRSSRPDR